MIINNNLYSYQCAGAYYLCSGANFIISSILRIVIAAYVAKRKEFIFDIIG